MRWRGEGHREGGGERERELVRVCVCFSSSTSSSSRVRMRERACGTPTVLFGELVVSVLQGEEEDEVHKVSGAQAIHEGRGRNTHIPTSACMSFCTGEEEGGVGRWDGKVSTRKHEHHSFSMGVPPSFAAPSEQRQPAKREKRE